MLKAFCDICGKEVAGGNISAHTSYQDGTLFCCTVCEPKANELETWRQTRRQELRDQLRQQLHEEFKQKRKELSPHIPPSPPNPKKRKE